MTTRIDTPQARGAGSASLQADITPPVGIYHRMWGAALHDRATGVHRPLMATAMYLESCSTAVPSASFWVWITASSTARNCPTSATESARIPRTR